MQTLDSPHIAESEHELPLNNLTPSKTCQVAEANPYTQALSDIAVQLHSLDAAFTELDDLRSEEKGLQEAHDQIFAEEKAILSDPSGSEKATVDKLVRVRATVDVRNAKLIAMRKRIGSLVDVIYYDLGQPLRTSLSNLANVLLNRRVKRIQALFDDLLGPPVDHGLMVNSVELTRRSRPVISLQQLVNWIGRESRPIAEEELSELRSEVPRRWLTELRSVIAQEQSM
jgi:hypothetical protein